jgi:hypothetical protein
MLAALRRRYPNLGSIIVRSFVRSLAVTHTHTHTHTHTIATPTGCKLEAVCNGIDAFCPSRPRKPVGTPCDDGDSCTSNDVVRQTRSIRCFARILSSSVPSIEPFPCVLCTQCSLDGICVGQRSTTDGCGMTHKMLVNTLLALVECVSASRAGCQSDDDCYDGNQCSIDKCDVASGTCMKGANYFILFFHIPMSLKTIAA